jgi:hypothetical protein
VGEVVGSGTTSLPWARSHDWRRLQADPSLERWWCERTFEAVCQGVRTDRLVACGPSVRNSGEPKIVMHDEGPLQMPIAGPGTRCLASANSSGTNAPICRRATWRQTPSVAQMVRSRSPLRTGANSASCLLHVTSARRIMPFHLAPVFWSAGVPVSPPAHWRRPRIQDGADPPGGMRISSIVTHDSPRNRSDRMLI